MDEKKMQNLEKLKSEYGEEAMNQIFEDYQLDAENNILSSYASSIVKQIGSAEELREFLDLFAESKDLKSNYSAGIINGILKNFLFKKMMQKSERIETFEEDEEIDEKDRSFEMLENIKEDTNSLIDMLVSDKSDFNIYQEIVEVHELLKGQLTKTEKKATYQQVEDLSKNISDIKKVLPNEVEKLYTTKDLLIMFGMGIGLTLIIIILISIIM